jgi:glutamate-5-semialdehyde dehydrogenase
MLRSVAEVANLRDPVGSILEEKIRPNALLIQKVRVPIGLIAIIFESRPNVTVDSATLCLRSGNAVVLRGGTDARRSNRALVEAIGRGLRKQGLAGETVTLVQSEEREAIKHLVQMEGVVDLVIPRGGEGLIRAVTEVARVPVIKHYKGVCHVFVDESASVEMAIRIVENAKCQRPGVCNALETLLVHERIAEKALPAIAKVLLGSGVELRGDDKSRNIVPEMQPAEESDWSEEYLDLILSVRIVPSLEEAIRHINRYGSHHSDAIVSEDRLAQERFLREIDSAAVYVNASTRFTDGGEFGLGAEIGISTDKLHARGPMGVEELTTYKYLINGSGQTR